MMKRLFIGLFLAAMGGLSAATAVGQADITLAKLFTDHMVLQQNDRMRIWGTAEPGTVLVITYRDGHYEATADENGKWVATLATGSAGGPHNIEVRTKDGQQKIVLSDVMVGEVWICSGQSNMQWPVTASAQPDRELELSKDFSLIRLFTVEPRPDAIPQDEFGKVRGWDVCGPDTVGSFSAVAYAFGRHLHQRLKVPIGLINTSLGGTRAEAWTSRAALESDVAFRPLLDHWDAHGDVNSVHRPGNLYNAMIAPLRGWSFRGVIWYQGESNVGRGAQYAKLFPLLIENWRKELAFGEPFPFYFVQLAPFRYQGRDPVDLPEIWDAQLRTFRSVPETGMAVITDITELNDIHPPNKHEVGRRLALWALAHCYSHRLGHDENYKDIVPSGPLFREVVREGNRLRVRFDFAQEELVVKGEGPLTEFTVCGPDGKFVEANAVIDGPDVVVWATAVHEPIAVRFAWRDTAQPNLFNRAGLPASPFRSDDFDLLSKGRDF